MRGGESSPSRRPATSRPSASRSSLGAEWAGDALGPPPEELDAAIVFAPVGALVPAALRAVGKGGTVVCAGIHMSDIPSFPYELLWGERVLRSVANLTRRDGEEFLALAPRVPVRTEVEVYPLEQGNEALARLRAGEIRGAAVLVVAGGCRGGARSALRPVELPGDFGCDLGVLLGEGEVGGERPAAGHLGKPVEHERRHCSAGDAGPVRFGQRLLDRRLDELARQRLRFGARHGDEEAGRLPQRPRRADGTGHLGRELHPVGHGDPAGAAPERRELVGPIADPGDTEAL